MNYDYHDSGFKGFTRRMNQRERDIMQIVAGLFVVGIALGLIFVLTSCAYNGTASVNLSLINSRSPAVNAGETNNVTAANGYSGGGHLEAEIPMVP